MVLSTKDIAFSWSRNEDNYDWYLDQCENMYVKGVREIEKIYSHAQELLEKHETDSVIRLAELLKN